MIKKILSLIIVISVAAFAQLVGPKASAQITEYNFGDIKQGDVVSYDFKVMNNGGDILKIIDVRASCGCTAAQPEKKELKPGESTTIKVTFNSKGRKGAQIKTVRVITNDPEKSDINFIIRCNILVDENKNFYFLEVNTRLQVEHPITEFVVGVDMVAQQIKIASGEKLELKQDNLFQRGHSFECRIYAEDPYNNFLPSTGKITFLSEPKGPNIRHDSGIYSGFTVPMEYDPILSKLITWGTDRESSRIKMVEALKNLVIFGITTTTEFLADVMQHPEFIKGNLSTHFLNDYFSNVTRPSENLTPAEIALVSIASKLIPAQKSRTQYSKFVYNNEKYDIWKNLGSWEIASSPLKNKL